MPVVVPEGGGEVEVGEGDEVDGEGGNGGGGGSSDVHTNHQEEITTVTAAPQKTKRGGGKKKGGVTRQKVLPAEWVQCESCAKWRVLPRSILASSLPDIWTCASAQWRVLNCDMPEETWDPSAELQTTTTNAPDVIEEDTSMITTGVTKRSRECIEGGGDGETTLSNNNANTSSSTTNPSSSFTSGTTTTTTVIPTTTAGPGRPRGGGVAGGNKKRRVTIGVTEQILTVIDAIAVTASQALFTFPPNRERDNTTANTTTTTTTGTTATSSITASRAALVPPTYVLGTRDHFSLSLFHPIEVWADGTGGGGILSDAVSAGISAALSSGVQLAPNGNCIGAIPTVRVSFKDVVPAYWGQGARRTAALDRADRGGLAHESALRWSRSAIAYRSGNAPLIHAPRSTIITTSPRHFAFSHQAAIESARACFTFRPIASLRIAPPVPIQTLGAQSGPRGILHRGWAQGASAASTVAKGLYISPLDAISESLAETCRWSGPSTALADARISVASARADAERNATREAARIAFRAALPPRATGDEALIEEMSFPETEVYSRARTFEAGFLAVPLWEAFSAADTEHAAIFPALVAALAAVTVGEGGGLKASEASNVLRSAAGVAIRTPLPSGTLSTSAGLGPRVTAVRLAALKNAGIAETTDGGLTYTLTATSTKTLMTCGDDSSLIRCAARLLCAEAAALSTVGLSAMLPAKLSKPWKLR